ncbi:MAG: glutamine-synthetase adenylyltransferase [Acidobacteriota bacterium]|nr:glutamine-synthetase adenylyltransferase [Acidobacteriota bacterium]
MQRLLEQPSPARDDVPAFSVLLESVPDRDRALQFLALMKLEAPDAFAKIAVNPTALNYLIALFSYSRFLSEAVIRNPDWLLELTRSADMHRVLSAEAYKERLDEWLNPAPGIPRALELARFRRRELLRIVLRDVLGLGSLSDVTEELSNLADSILHICYERIRDELARVHGMPLMGGREAVFSVISLGKLGGRELNYSSDIDLLFLYSGAGETHGAQPIANQEFFKKIANQYTELLSTYTADGMCYRVDLRLRPDGRYGEVCHSLAGAKAYYKTRARDWELQMLIKARVSAGDPRLGRDLLDFVEPLIYSTTLDFKAIESVSEARERISEKLKRSHRTGLDIKLTRGGIRDIEFLVQCLQRLHGGRETWVRSGGTLFALFRLRDKDLLSDSEYGRLASAYQFLRNLEHRLQFDEDRQTHALPENIDALDTLACKMPATAKGGACNAGSLEREIDGHLESVQELYERVIHSRRPASSASPNSVDETGTLDASVHEAGEHASPNLVRFLDRKAPGLAALVNAASASGVPGNRERLEHFLEKIVESEWLRRLDKNPRLTLCVLDLFAHSQFFADQLIRHPELLEEVSRAVGDRQGRVGFEPPQDPGSLRKFFREQMVRIQSDSIHHRVPVFKTLKRTSDLADSVIAASYRIALAEAIRIGPPAGASYAPADQMMVIALGRLGMREFDLASDADLVFVLPDRDASQAPFWTGVAERMIHAISAYTGGGVIFTVDTRLRPNGGAGALVQTEGFYKNYFAKGAEAWEGITYMKSRAVAGNAERATEFLNELQEVDWRRYGQDGRSRSELKQMRARLEKEQSGRNPLKAGAGGYYDIDFALMYLRLRGAGMFFKVLNTPERIDIVEKMGHLERDDANFLREAATFYRSLDHAMRVATGHAEGRLPKAKSQLAVLTELVERWTPGQSHELSLESKLSEIRLRTRRFFERVFA